MRKKIPITYSKERVVLSDVLPYETTLIFSNRYFYNYLIKRNKSSRNENFRHKHNKAFEEIEKILFHREVKNIPFKFSINHKVNDFRELNIIHPVNQVMIVDFYKKYKDLILYYCSISPFSIRRPASVAKFVFYNDLLHKKSKDGDLEHSQIEQEESEYENLKSYFTYHKYSNIHRFFESYQFHRSEKKYNKLLKIDISKCFDSIYTHTIAWAVLNKSIVKDNVQDSLNTFPGQFDYLMQKLNANETNGIVIGPEFSRIFAEIILQQIDKYLYDKLKLEDIDGKNLIHKIDYEIFRYIDDYFVFYNHDNDAERIVKEFKLCLSEYNLYLNESKSIPYKKPIITDISLAKQKITDLFSEHLKIKERIVNGSGKNEDITTLYFSSNNVITRFKSIVKETNVEYKDIMNYSLAILDRKTAKVIETYKTQQEVTNNIVEKEYEKGILEILDVAFFLYSVSPRVNSTIKLCLILDKIISFLRRNNSNDYKEPFSANNKHNIFKKISDEIYLILQKNRSKSEAQIETLYLIIALSQLGREYRLNPKVLCSYFNIVIYSNDKIEFKSELNYFSITTLLFYIKDIELYSEIREAAKKYIKMKFQSAINNPNWKRNTELVLLLMDSLSCPFLNEVITPNDKKQIIFQLDKLEYAALKPITDLSSYIEELKRIIVSLGNTVFFKKLKREAKYKIVYNFNQYSLELKEVYGKTYKLSTGFNLYKYEEAFINAIISLRADFVQYVDKYKFKKELLSSLDIKKNQITLIEQEKFWFIKWTEFDFKMELQAKRSQEVY